MRHYYSGRKRTHRIGLLVSFLAAFLMVAGPAGDGWAMGVFNRFMPPPPPPPPPVGAMVVDAVGPDGRPMGGVKIAASFIGPPAGSGPVTTPVPSPAGVTGSTGKVQFPSVPSGTWQVTASLSGFKQEPESLRLVVPPRGTGQARVQMVPLAPPKPVMVPLTINVVSLGGRPVAKADVQGVYAGPIPTASKTPPPIPSGAQQQFRGLTGPTGRLTFSVTPGKWRLSIVAPEYRPFFNVLVDVMPGAPKTIGFQLSGIGPTTPVPPKPIVPPTPTKSPVSSTTGALNVVVLAESNRPIANARVTASTVQPLPIPGAWGSMKSGPSAKVNGVTGPDGRILFPNLPPGKYAITVEASGFRAGNTQGSISVGQVATIQLRLAQIAPPRPPVPPTPPVPPKPPVPVTGTGLNLTVVASTNKPVVNAHVTAEGQGPRPVGPAIALPARATGTTGPSGAVFLKLSPGSYRVTIEASGFKTTTIGASVNPGSPTPVKVVLPPAAPQPPMK